MAFNYTDTLLTDRDLVRFYTSDTVENGGPKPSGGNFSDNEVDGLITAEGSWQRAVAGAFEILAGKWAQYADIQVGPRREAFSKIAERFESLAKTWRTTHGGSASGAGVRQPTRIDGYSDDVGQDEV